MEVLGCDQYQYSQLLDVPVEYLKAPVEYLKAIDGYEDGNKLEFSQLDQQKLKAVNTLQARLQKLLEAFISKDMHFYAHILFGEFWAFRIGFLGAMMNRQNRKLAIETAEKKCLQYLSPPSQSTQELFGEDIDIPVLVDLASKQLLKIKDFNSREVVIQEDDNINEVRFQEMTDHYSSIYQGIFSLDMKMNILFFHFKHQRCGVKADLVGRFLASVEDELRQYEEEIKTTRFKVFESAKKRYKMLAYIMSAVVKITNTEDKLKRFIKSLLCY
ncbi:hypothetical protein OROMI_017692 [Orobanche minor]